MAMAVVGQVAAVVQLIGNVGGLILKIKRSTDTAKRNKRECDNLVLSLSVIEELLPSLPHDPEVARPLDKLRSTLEEANELVLACQKRRTFSKLIGANMHADRFNEVNAKINSDISLFTVVSYSAIARRLDNNGTVDPAGSSSSGSVAVQTQMVVTHVSSGSGDNPMKLTWAEIKAATNNLAVELGGGRSGTVYKGRLHHHGRMQEVAVKALKKNGRQGIEDSFVAELEILFPIRHDHIARLVGWCAEDDRRMFVYEHMSNGTLRDHLLGEHGRGSPVASSWKARLEVLLGASRALQHLHLGATLLVIHRNVSSSNILLDESWKAHLSDFGHALLRAACGENGQVVREAIGAFGYLDPEHYSTMRVSTASDVYSFGVVMLEVLTGRPPCSSSDGKSAEASVTLVSSVLPDIQNGKLRDVLDPRPSLRPTPKQLEALELVANTAVVCLWPEGRDRLAMSKVVANLETALAIVCY